MTCQVPTEPAPAPTGGLRAQVEMVDPLAFPQWDRLVSSHPEARFFHGSAWARALRQAYGHTPVYFLARDGQRLLSLLCVMEVNSVLTGRRGVSLPFTDSCEPLVSAARGFPELFGRALEHGKERGWKRLECRGGTAPVEGAAPSLSFFNHTLDLEPGETRLFEGFKSSVRRAVRKAEGSGLTVERVRDPESMAVYYRLHCMTREKHGLPPQPFSWFRQIGEEIISKGQGFVAIVREGREPAAAAVFFHFGKEVIYKYGASNPRFQHLRPTNLLFWEVIKLLAKEGFTGLDFGRTSVSNEGLRQFKLGWGARERLSPNWVYDLRGGGFTVGKDRAAGWHNAVFSSMPGWLSRAVGGLLYRHIS